MSAIDSADLKRLMREFTALKQRGISPITEAQLDGFRIEAETLAKEELLANRQLDPFARLIIPVPEGGDTTAATFDGGTAHALPGGRLAVLHFPLPLPDDSNRKSLMFAKLRFVCQALAALAVIVVSDAWTLCDMETGHLGTSREGMTFVNQHGSVAAAKAGFGTLIEVLVTVAQTRDKLVSNTIPYERRFKGGVLSPNGQNPLSVPHTINILNDKAMILRCPQDQALNPSNMILIYEGPQNER